MAFQKAARKAVPLKIALQGVSFAGKTMSGIKLAHGLANGKPVCVIDTENESAAMYDHLDFLHAPIAPPFKPDKFIALIREAVALGAGAIVIDSLSHAWQYILDYKDQLDAAGGKGAQWSNWAKAKPLWQTLKDAILQSPVHVVVTFREKADYAIETNDDGRSKKSEVKKLGTKAVAEEGTEYEFTTVWKLDKDTHLARVEKDRTGLFDGRTFIIDEGVGRELLGWLGVGEIEAGAAWSLLSSGDPEEFRKASEESEAARRDQARAIITKCRLKRDAFDALKDICQKTSRDWVTVFVDGARYGATDADRLIRYVCAELGYDPVPICRLQARAQSDPQSARPAPAQEPKKDCIPNPNEPQKKEVQEALSWLGSVGMDKFKIADFKSACESRDLDYIKFAVEARNAGCKTIDHVYAYLEGETPAEEQKAANPTPSASTVDIASSAPTEQPSSSTTEEENQFYDIFELKSQIAWKTGEWARFEATCKTKNLSVKNTLKAGLDKGFKTAFQFIEFAKAGAK